MQADDISAADSLREAAGWNQRQTDWLTALAYQPDGCFVAVCRGQIAGTVTTTSYGTELGWIGMMLVAPSLQRRGIATQLMETAIEYLQELGIECIRLDATPTGRIVYERLGFQSEWDFHRWERSHGPQVTIEPAPTVSMDTLSAELVQLDRDAFGTNRSAWLKAAGPHSRCVGFEQGFGMSRTGSRATYLGPVVAESTDAARRIAVTLLNDIAGPVFWDIPGPNIAATRMAQTMGFLPVRDLTRMRLGPESVQPDYSRLYGLYDPGMG